MKIIKRVRYQRVPYSQLEDGDRFMMTTGHISLDTIREERVKPCSLTYDTADTLVPALDLDKYPPEVTWDVVNVPEEYLDPTANSVLLDIPGMMGAYETIYE